MTSLDKYLATFSSFMLIKAGCPYCINAEKFLDGHGIRYEKLDYTQHRDLDADITARTGHRTYPKIYLDGKFVGGYTDLVRKHREGPGL